VISGCFRPAIRIGASPLTQQAQYDLAHLRTDRIKLKRYTDKRRAGRANAAAHA
jgi:hypothetical protein